MVNTIPDARDFAWLQVLCERNDQDEQWGGPEHDDQHTTRDWADFIDYQCLQIPHESDPTGRYIKIMALALAALESYQRTNNRPFFLPGG